MAKTGKGYDYETLDGKTRYSESKPSRTFLALNGVLFLLAFCAISRSFGHHARKEAGIYLPPPQQKMSYKEILASFSPECPSSSSLSSVSWNLTSTEKPAFEFFAMKSHDLTILGPKSTLVQELTEAMAAVLSEPTRERRHAAHHLDKLFYWTKTLSVFSQSEFLLPSIKDSQSSSIVSPDLFLRASSLTETLEIHYDESLEVPIFILRGGELWMSAVAGNGKLGVQALVQALLQAMEFGIKDDGAESGRFYLFSEDSSTVTCSCADATLSHTITDYLDANSPLPPPCSGCENLSKPFVQFIMPTSSGFSLGRDPNTNPLLVNQNCQFN